MIRFCFNLKDAACNNRDEAKIRESTRMACIAKCLRILGHDAYFQSISPEFHESDRWKHFADIPHRPKEGGFTVNPPESIGNGYSNIFFKCSMSTAKDMQYIGRCGLLVATESDGKLRGHEKLLSIPFFPHDDVLDEMFKRGLFEAYINNDLDTIRSEMRVSPHEKDVGISAYDWPLRREFMEGHPDWVDCTLYDHKTVRVTMNGWEHARWITGFKAAIALRGDTPKTNLPPLLAMLGVPIIAPEPEPNSAPLDKDSMILFRDWDQVSRDISDSVNLQRIADNATRTYVNAWSPMGIAKHILERIR